MSCNLDLDVFAKILANFGMVLDVVGAGVLIFWVVEDPMKDGVLIARTESEDPRRVMNNKLKPLSFTLILVGFLLQGIASWF